MKCGIPLEAWMRWGLGQGECARVESVVSQVVEETWRIYRETLARWAKNLHFSAKTQLSLGTEVSRNSLKSIRELSRPLILRADETNAEIQAQISRSVCMSVVMALPFTPEETCSG